MRLRWSLGHGLTAMYNLTRTQQYLLLLMLIYRGLGFLIHNYIVLQCDLPHTVGRHPRAEIRTRDAGDVQAENLTTRLSHLLPYGECLGGGGCLAGNILARCWTLVLKIRQDV